MTPYEIPAERKANVVAFAIDQPEDTNVNDHHTGIKPTALVNIQNIEFLEPQSSIQYNEQTNEFECGKMK